MLTNLRLQSKLLVRGILLTVLPLAATSIMVLGQNGKMVKVAEEESANLVSGTCTLSLPLGLSPSWRRR
jgi:hypothetical protein